MRHTFHFRQLAPLTTLWLALAASAQTAAPMHSPASAASGAMQPGHMQSMPSRPMGKGMGGSHDMKQSMMTGMDGMQKMQMSGNVDKDFAMMMKMHHQQAVEMSKMQLAHGQSAEMKAMASRIIAAQNKEIAQFDRWLAKQK